MTFYNVQCYKCDQIFTTTEEPEICCKSAIESEHAECDCGGEPLNNYLCFECWVEAELVENVKDKIRRYRDENNKARKDKV